MNQKYSKTILRIAPYPTFEESGRGLHPYELSNLKNIRVIYLAFFKKEVLYFDIPKNVKLFIGSFYTTPYPRSKGLFIVLLFQLYRLYKIFIFSLYGIFLMLKYKIDIVHVHSPMFSLVSIVAKIAGKKNIITFHGTDFFQIRDAIWYKPFSIAYDLVFSISPLYLKTLSDLHNSTAIQTYNGIDKKIYKDYGLKRKKQIIAVGALKEAKGLEFLIKGFSLFIKKFPELNDYNLIIVGEGILRNELESIVLKYNLEKKVFLVGQKNRNQVIKLYNESEIFILSSLWEGFAKVLVEAMSCGCKVISTNVGSSEMILRDWGYIINHSDPKAISEAFYKIINNKNYPFDMHSQILKEYSWNRIRDMYLNKLKSIL